MERKKPNGADILAILIKLYSDQEGVEITYERRGQNQTRKEANRCTTQVHSEETA